ncbi:MAG: complex I NDUFA9 subunit family protein [Pyrinomonadaceae bacterium]|nr:complex I NDUFA9 subunit family protein [Pyrinomonadaceae bacterium]
MRVLVTGGTGVIGEGVIPALLKAGHAVRLLTRGAGKDAEEWPEGVEPFEADVSDARSLSGAADDCESVVHITGIINESPPRVTFERVNVEGTRNVLREATRAGAARFIYISSLGADRGRSSYHQSKRQAEEIVREARCDWLILRPGGVYGPGDEVISALLKLIRTLPAIPVVDGGGQRFQPVWFEDVGKAVVRAIEQQDLSGQTLELAGAEITTVNDIIDRLSAVTGRTPSKITVPAFIASLGAQLFEGTSLGVEIKRVTGLDAPVDEAKLQMLLEENFIEKRKKNALVEIFGITPLSLDEGLKALADLLPEQTASDGVGELERKRFYADIEGSRYDAAALLEEFRARVMEVMPLEFQAEPGAAGVVEKGATLTASIPLRGNIQVRVEELTARRITFVTLEGHPLAGVVQFKTSSIKKGVRFMIEIHTRHASLFDRLTMSLGGSLAQDMNWQEVVERVVELSGGTAPGGVKSESVTLDEERAARAEAMIEGLVKRYNLSVKAEHADKGTRKARASSRLKKPKGKSASRRSAKKPGDSVEPSDNVSDVVETVSQAASSLVESVSAAALNLTRAASKKGAKK